MHQKYFVSSVKVSTAACFVYLKVDPKYDSLEFCIPFEGIHYPMFVPGEWVDLTLVAI